MKIAIIIPANLNSSPFVSYFTDIFDKIGIVYTYIIWDKSGLEIKKENTKIFYLKTDNKGAVVTKLIHYYKFSKFVKRCIKNDEFDFILVHTLAIACFLKPFLVTEFKNRYILDIRDWSPILTYQNRSLTMLCANSMLNIVSSKGFFQWLPESDYLLSHNTRIKYFTKLSEKNFDFKKATLNICTIGQIGYYEQNLKLMIQLGHDEKYRLVFHGEGEASTRLKLQQIEQRYKNVFFTGRYDKENERNLVRDADFMNLIADDSLNSRTLMSNRFYLSIISFCPMIVLKGTYQAKLVKKFNLGIIVEENCSLKEMIENYIHEFNPSSFVNSCCELIKIIEQDLTNFEKVISQRILKDS